VQGLGDQHGLPDCLCSQQPGERHRHGLGNLHASTPVTVALDNGATGTGPTARQMKSGTKAITYGIYRDAAATLPWGNTSGTNTASLSSGTGTLTAYGRVPAQVSPAPGSYADVVNVIITY